MAVATSTLMLWRSIGSVLGVAASSLILQNALLVYLNQNVVGPEKANVIKQVRVSVRAIAVLAPMYQEQVITSYEQALRVTFMGAAVASIVCMVIVLRLKTKVPRL